MSWGEPARYLAADALVPDPSPGQQRVRELAAAAVSPGDLIDAMRAELDELETDAVLGHAEGLWEPESAYADWQRDRGTPADPWVLQNGVAVRKIERGCHGISGTRAAPRSLATMLATAGAYGPQTGTEALHMLFHTGFHHLLVGKPDIPRGTLLADEGIVRCGGGSHRTAAHIAAGVMVTTQMDGKFDVIRSVPDEGLLATLVLHDRTMNTTLRPPRSASRADIEMLRDAYVALLPLLHDAEEHGIRTERPDEAPRLPGLAPTVTLSPPWTASPSAIEHAADELTRALHEEAGAPKGRRRRWWPRRRA